MSEDIEYNPSQSIYADNGQYAMTATSPCHKPCADMAGMVNPDPSKTERARFLLAKLREKHGIKKRSKRDHKPMTYTCTAQGCIEPWGSVNNAKP
ncbi:hypothetical protein [Vibrio brasiliensis]|uniref:hypothetical protein n=1 Tax=Vibrio brasiliensis TaxID=170652 RepID=UPI0030B8992B